MITITINGMKRQFDATKITRKIVMDMAGVSQSQDPVVTQDGSLMENGRVYTVHPGDSFEVVTEAD